MKWTRAGQVAALAGDNVQLEDMLELPPSEAFARMRARDAVEATHFIAHCLPRLQALQWLSQCLATMTPTTLARRLAARKAVNRWLADPSDANRRLAFEAGDNAGFDTPEGCACLTLFLSGGSLAPATQEQPVLPPPAAFGQLLASAVLLATLNDDPPNHARRLATALADAEQLAATAEGRA
ncbi:DUF6931 family protein [Polymorphobacter multimanifer]|uniref:Uncharacterized protein n=1 Tax=Polymorphobacter multimanifer TaxID=1070431 RepID=A0A841LCB4_9SPHN|nr:hypothetical protein [Polymorphobacter multimanifer]MBB6227455.1 hypothetical protein [Polymorphobacter multimanifer]